MVSLPDVMGDLHLMFEFFMKTYQEDCEQNWMMFEILASQLKELSNSNTSAHKAQGKAAYNWKIGGVAHSHQILTGSSI